MTVFPVLSSVYEEQGWPKVACNNSVRASSASGRVVTENFQRGTLESVEQGGLLSGQQLLDAGLSEDKHVFELSFGEGGFFAGALKLNELAGGVHHQVE